MKNNERLKIAYKYCRPLKVEYIKKELDSQLEGYTFKSIVRETGEWAVSFEGLNKDYITLYISLDGFSVLKNTATRIERLAIDNNLLLTDRIIDKRPNGVIYSIIQKQFAKSNRFNQIVLTDLVEQRFTLTREKINSLLKNADFDNIRLISLLLKLRMSERKVDLKSQSNFYSEFSTHMNYYFNPDDGRKIKDNIYPTRTYLNKEEVSSIFDIDGPDKLYRIYDLYNGIINHRNENDINSINLGFLSQDAFNLKELKGINAQENFLVGEPLLKVSDTYINYLKEFFYQKFGYKYSVSLDRDSMLSAITFKMSGLERAKKEIETKLEIPFSEFEQLDFDQQRRLIEQKTGKKFKYDYRLHIDGIPIDEQHIITREQIDRKMAELNSNRPNFLRRLIRPFNKK